MHFNDMKISSSRSDFDPRVTNAFQAAAFRVGHTLIPDVIKTFSAISGAARRTIDLQETFSDGDILRETNFVDELIKGMTIQPSEDYDNNFVPDVSTQLFDIGMFGLDLIAINIQRGRDQGLPVYLLYRHACGTAGGGQITEFDQLGTNISPAVSKYHKKVVLIRAVKINSSLKYHTSLNAYKGFSPYATFGTWRKSH